MMKTHQKESRARFRHLIGGLTGMLARRRREIGLSQRDLDQHLRVATGVIAKWESGFRSPTGYNLSCWARALGCDIVLVPRRERENEDLGDRPWP